MTRTGGSNSDSGGDDADTGGGSDGNGSPEASLSSTCDDVRGSLPGREGAVIAVSPASDGLVTVEGAEATLRSVVQNAGSGSVIELQPGTYTIPAASEGSFTGLYFTEPDVTLRGATGDAEDVVIDSAYRELRRAWAGR